MRRATPTIFLGPGGEARPEGPGVFQARHPPVSNAERQRQFRERNPGYYGRRKAKERAASKAWAAARVAEVDAVTAILYAYTTQPLMLPAPVEPIEIPGMTTIPLRDAIPVSEFIEARRRDAA
jgi:hypothetical protein